MAANRLGGVFAAVLTPLDLDGIADPVRLAAHCRWLLSRGCDGLAVLGTTGEANSFSVDERLAILDGLADAGISGDALLPGTGCCAVADTVALSRRAVTLGAAAVLMLPPYYYKNVSDDGLFAAYAEVIEGVGDRALKIVLYHFPQMTGVPLSVALIERLVSRYPDTVIGMKDSSDDLSNMISVCRTVPGFKVFSGSDERLLPLLRAGGAGCITAVANIASPQAAEVLAAYRAGDEALAERRQAQLTAIRRVVAPYAQPPALKDVLSRHFADPGWRRVRPPLVALADAASDALENGLLRAGFSIGAPGA